MVRHPRRNVLSNNHDDFVREVVKSVTLDLAFDNDEDSGNGESISPVDSPNKADEASAVLERLAAEDTCRAVTLPDAWPDDAQIGHEPNPTQNQPNYDLPNYDLSNYDLSSYGQGRSGYNQSGYLEGVQTQKEQPTYNSPALLEPGFGREQISYDLSRNAQPVPTQSGIIRACYEQSGIGLSGQNKTGVIQLVQIDRTGSIPLNQGTGVLASAESSVEESETSKGAKRKFFVSNGPGQAYVLAEEESTEDGTPKKIPRPPNAFMLYANEYRRIIAKENPNESNKEISVRLGNMWKTMQKDVKERYFDLARVVDAEHKKKYPNYVYNPKEARMRKAIREQTREYNRSTSIGKSPSPSKRPNSVSSQGSSKSSMGGSVQRVLHDGVMGVPGVGGKKGYMPMYPPAWGEMASQQYVVPDNFMDVSAAYQNHDQGAAVYPNMMHSWYPCYVQQDHAPAYGQSWQQHGAPLYVQQQQQRMQHAQHAQGAASQSAQGYMAPFEAPTQQNVPAKPPGPPKQVKPTAEDSSTQPTTNTSTAVALVETSTIAKKSSQPNQVNNPANRLPAFVQAFGQTEIGRYHNDGFTNQSGAGNAVRAPQCDIDELYDEDETGLGLEDSGYTFYDYQREFYSQH